MIASAPAGAPRANRSGAVAGALLAALLLTPAPGSADPGTLEAARPGSSSDHPLDRPRDLTGKSIKTRRVRAVHSTDASMPGASSYLLFRDPWLGYQRGRELLLREFSAADGVFGEAGKLDGPRLEDGATHMMSRDHASSCAMCHHTPWRDMGAGGNIAKNGGRGRNTPHLFGAGLIEMLGWQGRLKLLALADTDRDGWISAAEAAGKSAWLRPDVGPDDAGMTRVALGRFDDADGDGRPDLDPVLAVWYVDGKGRRIAWARTLRDPGVAGYSFEYQVFGHGHHPRQTEHGPPIPSTLRAFTATAFDVHSGLQPFDPTILDDDDGDGLSGVSLAGARQFTSAAPRDRGAARASRGTSLDDPDRDGVPEEISQGDLDLAEWFLLNHPQPAERTARPGAREGRERFQAIGCARCHVPDWRLEPAAPESLDYTARFTGDRRFFHLQVVDRPASGASDRSEAARRARERSIQERNDGAALLDAPLPGAVAAAGEASELRGSLVPLTRRAGEDLLPARHGFIVRGLYSDLATHDLGEGFAEVQFDGSVIRRHRTPPLWGVGSSGPYGHDGASLDLDDVIRRHGGEAAPEAYAYSALHPSAREQLLAFLRSLVLYSTEDLPCDLDGDGDIDDCHLVAGIDTGRERFNPEWLFRQPGKMEGPVPALDGSPVVSRALLNVDSAYGSDLEWLRDADGDGFPDRLERRDGESE